MTGISSKNVKKTEERSCLLVAKFPARNPQECLLFDASPAKGQYTCQLDLL